MSFYDTIRFHLVPPLFLVVFTGLTQVLITLGNPDLQGSWSSVISRFFSTGNAFAWKVIGVFFLWGLLSLVIPSKTFKGPTTPHGHVPSYSANGTQFYLVSLVTFLLYVTFVDNSLCINIYDNFSAIVAALNVFSLVFCAFLFLKAIYAPDSNPPDPEVQKLNDLPIAYQFYRGVELHPKIFGVDIKQWTNCRVGMLGWALLVIVFCIAGIQKNGEVTLGPIVNAVLINIYLCKFFYWETGYFNTLDITLDRAGYYLCWGCLCWVQVFYTFSAYFMVSHPCKTTNSESAVIFMFGVLSIFLNYYCDRQKQLFRERQGNFQILGRKANTLTVDYIDHQGKKKRSLLLVDGFWGQARHMNYVFEIMIALSWSLPAVHHGLLPFMYVFFLIILLVHRTFRDEKKCSEKYGEGWKKYCQRVPYRFIPFIV